jgi:cell division protein FtsQ
MADAKKTGIRWRLWLELTALGLLCVASAAAAVKIRKFMVTGPQFMLSRNRPDALTVEGAQHTSRAKVLRVFATDFGRSVFSIPLAERRRRLLAIDWVEDASVSRVWPDRLVVRIRERTPVAFVIFPTGVMSIDADGVLLETPPQAKFSFPVLSGVTESDSETVLRERVHSMLRVLADLGPLAKDVSEVNVSDPENIRLVAQVAGRAVELIMGGENYARRYQNFLNHYPEIRKRSPQAKTFDLRLDDRIMARN